MGVLAFVGDSAFRAYQRPKNESALSTLSQEENTNKPGYTDYVSITGTGAGSAILYTVPAGRRLYVQSAYLYDSANGGNLLIRDGGVTGFPRAYLFISGGGGAATYPAFVEFPSPVIFEKDLTLIAVGFVYSYSFIGYLL